MSMFSQSLMKDKVCLITGGSRGGMLQQIAQDFVDHGAKAVILMSRNKEANEKVAAMIGPNCHSEPGNVVDVKQCQEVCQRVVAKFGQIDVLVNGAAGNFLATAE